MVPKNSHIMPYIERVIFFKKTSAVIARVWRTEMNGKQRTYRVFTKLQEKLTGGGTGH
jgi:hypothetical protein